MMRLIKFLFGLSIGAAAGVLLAPKSGREFREQLLATATDRLLPPPAETFPHADSEDAHSSVAVAPEAEHAQRNADEVPLVTDTTADMPAASAPAEPVDHPSPSIPPEEPAAGIPPFLAEPLVVPTIVEHLSAPPIATLPETPTPTASPLVEALAEPQTQSAAPFEETPPAVTAPPVVSEEPPATTELDTTATAQPNLRVSGIDLLAQIEATRAAIAADLAEPFSSAELLTSERPAENPDAAGLIPDSSVEATPSSSSTDFETWQAGEAVGAAPAASEPRPSPTPSTEWLPGQGLIPDTGVWNRNEAPLFAEPPADEAAAVAHVPFAMPPAAPSPEMLPSAVLEPPTGSTAPAADTPSPAPASAASDFVTMNQEVAPLPDGASPATTFPPSPDAEARLAEQDQSPVVTWTTPEVTPSPAPATSVVEPGPTASTSPWVAKAPADGAPSLYQSPPISEPPVADASPAEPIAVAETASSEPIIEPEQETGEPVAPLVVAQETPIAAAPAKPEPAEQPVQGAPMSEQAATNNDASPGVESAATIDGASAIPTVIFGQAKTETPAVSQSPWITEAPIDATSPSVLETTAAAQPFVPVAPEPAAPFAAGGARTDAEPQAPWAEPHEAVLAESNAPAQSPAEQPPIPPSFFAPPSVPAEGTVPAAMDYPSPALEQQAMAPESTATRFAPVTEPVPVDEAAPPIAETPEVVAPAPMPFAPVPTPASIFTTPTPAADTQPNTAAPTAESEEFGDGVPLEQPASGPSAMRSESVNQAEMRQRIEETRARLKAKAFDAMMSGEIALLRNDGEAAPLPPTTSGTKLEPEIDSTIDRSLSQED
ncbi:MAG: hypothetical protein R2826_06805 [Thermoleophilia bacterium]